jgi:hypothetical protein
MKSVLSSKELTLIDLEASLGAGKISGAEIRLALHGIEIVIKRKHSLSS